MSTADISVFTLQRLYTLPTTHVSLDARVCKALTHFRGEWQEFATRPLQRFSNLQRSAKVSGRSGHNPPNEEDALTRIVSTPQEDRVSVFNRLPTEGYTQGGKFWVRRRQDQELEGARNTKLRQVRAARCVTPYVLYGGLYCLWCRMI
jgi:hypothetical protein